MVNYYYDDKLVEGIDLLVVDIDQKVYITIGFYVTEDAENPKDYDYKNAGYHLNKKPYSKDGVLLNNNEFFLKTLKHDGKNLYRNLIKTVL